MFFIAYSLYLLFSLFYHWFSGSEKNEDFNTNLSFIYLFVSPSYFSAKFYKANLNEQELTFTLKRWNIGNFFISLSFLMILSIAFFINLSNLKNNSTFFLFLTYFWGIRCFSRSIEIILAFFKDITTKGNSSSLTKYDRIKLATISYIEVILNFGIFYFLFYNFYPNVPMLHSEISNLILKGTEYIIDNNKIVSIPIFYSNNIFYFTFSSFFISTGTKIVGINPFFILQLSTSLSLLIFAIAGYISDIKKLSNENNGTD